MKQILTFMNRGKSESYLLNNDISIKEALIVLSQNDGFVIPQGLLYIYSKRKQESVSINYTFKQAGIYAGDVLEILENGGRNNE